MCSEPVIHAVCIGLQLILQVGRQRGEAGLRQPIKPERANELVDAERVGAGHLRQPPLSRATLHFHLKQPFARMNVAERASGIVSVGGKNVRNAPTVPINANLGRQAGQAGGAAVIRHRAFEYNGGRSRGSRDDQSNG